MNKRILKNGLTGLLCIVLLLTNILSVGMEATATELNSSILDAVENLNDDNNEDTEEIIENDGQEEDSNLEESDDSGSQNDDNNQENSDSENENRDEEIENKENEEIDNSEEESEEIENDIDEMLDEDDEILEESEELKEEAEIATVATEEETLSEISGQCGDNLTWVLEDGTLTISGTGDMWDYSITTYNGNRITSAPWGKYCWPYTKSVRLIIEEGVTSIGEYAFYNCQGIREEIQIPDSVVNINMYAFYSCIRFRKLILGSGITKIGAVAFGNCSDLSDDLIIPESINRIDEYAFDKCTKIGNVYFRGNAPEINYDAFRETVVNVYYPLGKSSWDNVIGDNFGGTLTWIPYSEGTSPWENGSTEGTTNFWFAVNTDASDLTYDVPNGYNKTQFNFDISLTHLGMEIDPESYEDVNMIIELPEGLSFSQDEEIRTTTSILGTIDKTNNKRDILNSIYIIENADTGYIVADKFIIAVKVTAKGYETPQVYTYTISVVGAKKHVQNMSPTNGYRYCGLDDLTCSIDFDQNVKSYNNFSISLREYDSGKIIEEYDMTSDKVTADIGTSSLSVRFNENYRNGGTILSADTRYYISISDNSIEFDDGTTLSGTSDRDYWNFKTSQLEYSLVTNGSAAQEIDFDIYHRLYSPLKALKIKEKSSNGTEGVCFGLAYAAEAWGGKYAAINLIGADGKTLKNFDLATKGKSAYTFHEYIQLAFIYQYSSSMQKVLNNSKNQYDKLYEAIIDYQNKFGPPVLLGVYDNKRSGHAIVPLAVLSESSDSVEILVYDCNGGHTPYSFLANKLILKKENDQFVGFEYGDYDNYFKFYVMDEVIDNVIGHSSYEEIYNLIFSDSQISSLDEIVACVDNIESATEDHLYWTDDNAISRAASSNTELSEIGITDGYKEISVDMPLNADVTLNLDSDTAQASFAGMSDYSVTYSKVIDDDIHSITVNGKASGSLLAEQTTEGVVLKADSLKDITVEVKSNDATVSKKTFSSEKDSVLVKEENNDIIIYEDSNGDGTYDRRIDSEIEDVTSAYAVAVTVQKDNKIWNEHGKKFALTTDSGATFVSSLDKVPEGNYVVYDVTGIDEGFFGASGVNTGVSVAVKDGDANVTVDYYTVTFYDQNTAYGGETFQRPQIVLKGKKALVPTLNPTKAGYSFEGWVTTDGGNQTFNFDTFIVGTTNIYASWTQNESVGYTITASAEEGGSITPNGSIHVNEGENQTFTIAPDSGYRLKSIVVDGKEEVPDEEKARESSTQQEGIKHYTFSDVRLNHIIRVVFEADNGNTGDSGNTGGNTGDSGNTGDNTGGNGNSGNTGGNTGDGGNSGNTGGSTGNSGSGENTGGNGNSSGNNGNTNSSGSNAGDNGSADSNSNNADGSGNTNATDNANNSHFPNSGAGNTMNTDNGAGNSIGNNKSNGVSNATSGSNGINPKTDSSKDTEPRTEDVLHIEIYATIAMITGLLYLVLYFADEGGITEDEKNEIVAALVKWAKQGSWVRKYVALVLIFFLLAYYHSIGKRTSVEWKTVYEK